MVGPMMDAHVHSMPPAVQRNLRCARQEGGGHSACVLAVLDDTNGGRASVRVKRRRAGVCGMLGARRCNKRPYRSGHGFCLRLAVGHQL